MFLALPHMESQRAVPVLRARGRKVDRPLRRLPAPRRLALRDLVQGAARRRRRAWPRPSTGCPSCTARRSPRAVAGGLAGLLSDGRRSSPPRPCSRAGSARPDGIVIDGKSGVTGAGAQGRKIDPMYLYTEANENVQAYGIGEPPAHAGDRAGAERAARASRCVVAFTPHLLPLNRGLFTTASVPLDPERVHRGSRRRCTASSTPASRSCACSPEGERPEHAPRRRLELLRRHRGRRTRARAARSACPPSTTWARAARPTGSRASTS